MIPREGVERLVYDVHLREELGARNVIPREGVESDAVDVIDSFIIRAVIPREGVERRSLKPLPTILRM